MDVRFPHLLSRLDAGRLHLKNRVVFPGHQTLLSERGLIGDRMRAYYEERARGGVGGVIIEGAAVHPTTVKFADYLIAYDERIVASLDELAAALHEYDCIAILQLAHSGSRMATFDSRRELWAPSDVRSANSPEIPHAMTGADIRELRESYRVSLTNARRSAIDGVEIHSAHEYLLGEFLSPVNNQRTDEYGGSVRNRARLLTEVLEIGREVVGDDFVMGVRLNGADFRPGGLELDDYLEIGGLLAEQGLIDYINVSAGTSRDNNRIVPTMEWKQGLYVGYAAAIREATGLPVFAVGRIKRPEHAEEVLAAGKADVIAEARALIADPAWVNKAASAPERIRPCIGCNQGCFGFIFGNHPITCTVNPAVGKERVLGTSIPVRAEPQRVVVVGGGPAGLEAAIAAAEFGHAVTVFESNDTLGGQVPFAASIPTRAELREAVDFQIREVDRLNVSVRVNERFVPSAEGLQGVDHVVVATGSRPRSEPIPSDGSVDVLAPIDVMRAHPDDLPAGPVAVIDGVGHFPSLAPAEKLLDAGRSVTIVVPGFVPGAQLDDSSSRSTLPRLAQKGATYETLSVALRVAQGQLIVADAFTGVERSIDAAVVVAAVGNVADDGLVAQLEPYAVQVHVIGDALAPRSVLHAIREGRLLGRALGTSPSGSEHSRNAVRTAR